MTVQLRQCHLAGRSILLAAHAGRDVMLKLTIVAQVGASNPHRTYLVSRHDAIGSAAALPSGSSNLQ